MQTHAMGPAAGWSWLKRAINLGRNNPKALFGAAALMMVVALVPSVIQLGFQHVLGADGLTATLWVLCLTTLLGLVIFPLLIGGFYRVVDATENNRPTHATAIFDTFRAGGGRGRLIALGLALTLIYLAVFGLIIGTVGSDLAGWYVQLMTLAQKGAPATPADLPALPDGIGTVVALMMLALMFTGGAYAIAFGQVALAGRTVGEALVDGFVGAFKNVLPLLVLLLLGFAAMLGAALLIGIVVAVLAALGSLVHPALGVLLALPVYLAFLVMLYVVIFGVMYFIWRDVCGPPAAAGPLDRVAA